MAGLLALVILIFGVRLAFQILPPGARNLTREVLTFFIRLVLGAGNKG